MTEEMKIQHATEMYEKAKEMLTEKGVKFQSNDEKMMINFIMSGDDIPLDIYVISDAGGQKLRTLSKMPLKVEPEKMVEMATAVCIANNGLYMGNFDYVLTDGVIFFAIQQGFLETDLSKELIDLMVAATIDAVDKYNDRFLMLNKGVLTLEKFIEMEQNK